MPLFVQIGWGIFRISLRYCLSQFSHVIVSISFIVKKSKREISLFFSAFRHFHQNRKMSTFSALSDSLSLSASLTDSCQKWRELKCSLNIFAPLWKLHLNLAPCLIMEYFESNVEVIRSQVKKANRTYTEISNLFKQNFPEVRRGFSERNLRLFCSKHGITKMSGVEIDAIIQDCVSEVSSLHFIRREIN